MTRSALYVLVLAAVAMLAAHGFRREGAAVARAELDAESRRQAEARAAEAERRAELVIQYETARGARHQEERDSALARAERAERRRAAAVAQAASAAARSRQAADSARAWPDSGSVERLVEAHEQETGVLRVALSVAEEQILAERAARLASDSLVASAFRQRDAVLEANLALRAALAASRVEADAWRAAARPELFGIIHVPPELAYAGGVATAIAAVVALR